MQPECRQHPTAQPEGLSKDYSARYSRGILSLSNYGPYKPCNPWHLSAGLVMQQIRKRSVEHAYGTFLIVLTLYLSDCGITCNRNLENRKNRADYSCQDLDFDDGR